MHAVTGIRLLALASLVAGAAFMVGAPPPAMAGEPRFLELTTPDFVIYSELNEKRTRAIAFDVTRFQDVVAFFMSGVDVKPRVTTRIFALDSSNFVRYARPGPAVGGFFHENPCANDIAIDAGYELEAAFRIVFHEYMHYVLRNSAAVRYPPWYDEGLAELLSTVEFTDEAVLVGRTPGGRRDVLEKSQWLPMRQLFAIPVNSPQFVKHKAVPSFYAESWVLMHYAALENPAALKQISDYLAALAAGKSTDQAFASAFGMQYEELDSQLKRYARGGKFRYVGIPNGRIDQGRAFSPSIRQMSDEESELALGEFILRVDGDTEAARHLFATVLHTEGSNNRAVAGYAQALDGLTRGNEADAELAKALPRSPNDPDLLDAKARLIFERGVRARNAGKKDGDFIADAREIRRLLAPAVNTEPLSCNRVFRYAQTFIGDTVDDSEALDLLARALQQMPRNASLWFTRATLNARDGKVKEAREAWANASDYASDPWMKDYAKKRLAEMDKAP